MASDFGDPLELFREALHNAYDWGAKEFKIIIIFSQGTHIRIEGYNNNQRSTLKRDILKDYLYWYTILGTIENQFPNRQLREFKVFCKH